MIGERDDSENRLIAERLRQFADMLQAQKANPFRVGAYRRAAETVDGAPPLGALYAAEGQAGLDALPGIGPGIAGAIAEMLDTGGRWTQLERLKGSLDPVALFRCVPGIGPELAERLHEQLGVDTLEALEIACHDGRVREVPGVGDRRAAAISAALAQMLGRSRIRRPPGARGAEPDVAILLDVDREYRAGAEAGNLPRIAPRRFNPEHAAWLPILHTTRGPWHFTALFSNTPRAHERSRTHDWVVLYFYADHEPERQRTVVTETRGALAGRRVVRGRESDCVEHFRPQAVVS